VKKYAVGLFCLFCVLGVLACGCHDGGSVGRRGFEQPVEVLRRTITTEPSSLDPQRAGDTTSFEILRDLFEGLTTESPLGEIVGGVAESWSVSSAGTEYVFRLREDARWTNGEHVTAQDFVRALRRAVDPVSASPSCYLLKKIRGAEEIILGKVPSTELGVQVVNDKTLKIFLIKPAPELVNILAHPVAYPRHKSADVKGPNTVSEHIVSNGAYELIYRVPASILKISRNKFYWDASAVSIAKIEYLFVDDLSSQVKRFRANQVDVTSSLSSADLNGSGSDFSRELYLRMQLSLIFAAFNNRSGVFRDSPSLRQALSLVIDREKVVSEILRAGQVPAYGIVPAGITGYAPVRYSWLVDDYSKRVLRARLLYSALGYDNEKALKIRVICPADDTFRLVILSFAAMWRETLGVEVVIDTLEYQAFLEVRKNYSKWDILLHGWNADYSDPATFLEIFRTGDINNDAGFQSSDFDSLLDMAESAASRLDRFRLLRDAEALLLQSYAVVPVYFPVTRRLVKPWVHGGVTSPMDHNYSKYFSIENHK